MRYLFQTVYSMPGMWRQPDFTPIPSPCGRGAACRSFSLLASVVGWPEFPAKGDRYMPARIDHVIVMGRDLPQLEATFVRLGFFVTGGGRHPHLGTQNRIIILDEGYIELLAIADPAIVSPTLTARLAHGEGWVGFAVQSAEIERETAAMLTRGVDARGPHVGRLVALDGQARGWRVTTLATSDLWSAAEPLPFLIQHDTAGERHRAELAGSGGLAPHPNGALRLRDVAIATDDLGALRERFAHA